MLIGRARHVLRGLFLVRSTLLVIFLTASLLFNVVMFVGGVIGSFVDDAFAAATGLTTAMSTQRKENRALADRNQKLGNELETERKRNRELADRNRRLGKKVDDRTRSIRKRARSAGHPKYRQHASRGDSIHRHCGRYRGNGHGNSGFVRHRRGNEQAKEGFRPFRRS